MSEVAQDPLTHYLTASTEAMTAILFKNDVLGQYPARLPCLRADLAQDLSRAIAALEDYLAFVVEGEDTHGT